MFSHDIIFFKLFVLQKLADHDALKAEAAERNEEIRELKLEIEHLKAEMGQEKQQKEQDLKMLIADKDKDLVCLLSSLLSLTDCLDL